MSLRARVYLYLAVVHLVFAAAAVLLFRQAPMWLFAVELAFLISLVVGIGLARRLLESIELAGHAARLIQEQELTTRVLPVGDRDVDALIAAYNRMVDGLRTERVRVQEQHHFLEQVLVASPSGVVILDFDDKIAALNPAAERLLNVHAATAFGRPLASLTSPVVPALASLRPGATEVVQLSGPRRLRCHRGTFMDRGFSRGFLMVEELTDEVRRFEREAYEKLIRVMSHEVNNSVTASNSLLGSALTYGTELPLESREDFTQALGVVIERTEQLNLFMRRFADVFRLPAPNPENHDLGALIAPIVRLLASRPEWAHVTWNWDLPDSPVMVSVDRGQFEQAILNILKNAAEAAGGDGVVTIRVRSEEGRSMLVVEDSGPGPGREAAQHLFTPFFSTKPNGQGIGLTLVQEILAGHGFEFALQHEPPLPTRFVIRF